MQRWLERDRPFELRPVELARFEIKMPKRPPSSRSGSARGEHFGDDPELHRALLAYASDFSLWIRHRDLRRTASLLQAERADASLDHAMWFHRPFRADEWLLYRPGLARARRARRGLTRGSIYPRDGTLVASVAQEGSLRERKDKPTG